MFLPMQSLALSATTFVGQNLGAGDTPRAQQGVRRALGISLAVTAVLTGVFLGHIKGLGIGTVLAAFTMGKVIGWMGEQMDKHVVFTSVLAQHRAKLAHSTSH